MREENLEIKVHSVAGRTVSDNSDSNEFQDLINNPWQPFHCTEDFKQAIIFVEEHYRKSQIDRHFNEGGCMMSNTFPTPPDGQCGIKSMRWISSCRNGKEPPSPHQTVGGFYIFETQ